MKKVIPVVRGEAVPDNAKWIGKETKPVLGQTQPVEVDLYEVPLDYNEGEKDQGPVLERINS